MAEKNSKKKIMIIAPPSTGHLTPLCCLIYELCKNKDLEVIFYSDEPYREQVLKTGAEFRLYSKPSFTTIVHKTITDKPESFAFLSNKLITFAHELLPQLIRDVEFEKPDLIIYDSLFSPAKYLLNALQHRFENGTSKTPLPKTLMFMPHFAFNHKLIAMMSGPPSSFNLFEYFETIHLYLRQIWLSFKFGLSFFNPLNMISIKNDRLNIVGVIPELQPFHNEFDSTFRFVGSCISEKARDFEIKDDNELKSLLNEFDSKRNDTNKLIYMSLGSVFNVNHFIFEKVIEALCVYDLKSPTNKQRFFKSSQLRLVIAMGNEGVNEIKEKIKSGEIRMPENVLLRARVPQLELLKRADLFITHCGMNSTNEAIEFKVPIVAIPLKGDQPLVAKRVCDELKFGVRLDPLRLEVNEIADAIDDVLRDESYLRNVKEFAKIALKYNGPVDGAKIVLDYLLERLEDKKTD